MFVEFPKWIRRPGKREVLVENADAEALQIAAWDAEEPAKPSNPLLSQLDHDQGGSLKGTGDDLPALRIAYKAKFGKKAYGGWDAAEITKRMEADA